VASAVCEIITIITSRYLSKTDDENAQILKTVVTEAILMAFDFE